MLRRLLLVISLCLASIVSARADDYPNKLIKWIIPYPPGGGVDAVGRVIGDKLAEILGVPVIVTHQPGGGGTLGGDIVRRAEPDGYTLLFNASVFIMGPHVMKTVPYNPVADFTPIAQIGEVPLLVISNPKIEAQTFGDLVKRIKADPKQFN